MHTQQMRYDDDDEAVTCTGTVLGEVVAKEVEAHVVDPQRNVAVIPLVGPPPQIICRWVRQCTNENAEASPPVRD
jgi:hypothetical protein